MGIEIGTQPCRSELACSQSFGQEAFEEGSLVPLLSAFLRLIKGGVAQIIVFTVSSIESSFGYHVAKGPEGWTHEDQAALTVARSYLNAMEGALWTRACSLHLSS